MKTKRDPLENVTTILFSIVVGLLLVLFFKNIWDFIKLWPIRDILLSIFLLFCLSVVCWMSFKRDQRRNREKKASMSARDEYWKISNNEQ